MAERRYQRTRRSYGQRYFQAERDSESGSNERYDRNGPLSPLRSPVNRDKRNQRNNKSARRPGVKNSLDFKVQEIEFPPLDKNVLTPDNGEIKHLSSKLDWATQTETFEKLAKEELQSLKKYRRKLEMGAQKEIKPVEMEEDSTVLIRRQKTVDYGKNTPEYEQYLHQIKRTQRKTGDPRTPNKYIKTSRRSWDMQIRLWRKSLHKFDPPSSADVSMTDVTSECSSSTLERSTSDISDNGSEVQDYRDNQSVEHFSHQLPEEETKDSLSMKDMISLESDNWANTFDI